MALRSVLITTYVLAGFALVSVFFLVLTHQKTEPIIVKQQKLALLRDLNQLVPATLYDNNPALDVKRFVAPELFDHSEEGEIYRARLRTQPVALFINTQTGDGYNGTIKLLIAIYADGRLAGVRVLAHKETPGLGDKIELSRADWIKQQFDQRSLKNTAEKSWAVKKDGGVFDQFTGATITPRAVIKAVKRTLVYYRTNQRELFQ